MTTRKRWGKEHVMRHFLARWCWRGHSAVGVRYVAELSGGYKLRAYFGCSWGPWAEEFVHGAVGIEEAATPHLCERKRWQHAARKLVAHHSEINERLPVRC